MPAFHLLLAALVPIIWGLNFVIVSLGLEDMPPVFFCALRFFFASVPAIFFIKPPDFPFRTVVWYATLVFGLQFSLVYLGIAVGITAGLTSLVLQVQMFFSLILAIFLLREIPNRYQLIGALIAFNGVFMVWKNLPDHASIMGFMLVVMAAFAWASGNFIVKKLPSTQIFGLVVWGSFVVFPPLFCVSLLVEGKEAILHSLEALTWGGVACTAYTVYLSTWFGYGVWNWLLKQHNMISIIPFTLLVPISGMLGSALWLDEPLYPWKIVAGTLIITGLTVNVFGKRLFLHRKRLVSSEA